MLPEYEAFNYLPHLENYRGVFLSDKHPLPSDVEEVHGGLAMGQHAACHHTPCDIPGALLEHACGRLWRKEDGQISGTKILQNLELVVLKY